MFKEFREFISRGSVLDLAIGIIIGAAFGRIVTSFVNDILMPPIGLILGNVSFQDMFISLNRQAYPSLADAQKAGAPTINYGVFINNIIDKPHAPPAGPRPSQGGVPVGLHHRGRVQRRKRHPRKDPELLLGELSTGQDRGANWLRRIDRRHA